jgi:hypothetical protein
MRRRRARRPSKSVIRMFLVKSIRAVGRENFEKKKPVRIARITRPTVDWIVTRTLG